MSLPDPERRPQTRRVILWMIGIVVALVLAAQLTNRGGFLLRFRSMTRRPPPMAQSRTNRCNVRPLERVPFLSPTGSHRLGWSLSLLSTTDPVPSDRSASWVESLIADLMLSADAVDHGLEPLVRIMKPASHSRRPKVAPSSWLSRFR